jgi:hypothetical protein
MPPPHGSSSSIRLRSMRVGCRHKQEMTSYYNEVDAVTGRTNRASLRAKLEPNLPTLARPSTNQLAVCLPPRNLQFSVYQPLYPRAG